MTCVAMNCPRGREATTTYNETLAGARKPSWAGVSGPRGVDAIGPDGKLLKYVSPLRCAHTQYTHRTTVSVVHGFVFSDLKPAGSADDALMAFQHRMCISGDADRVPWPKPAGYQREDFLLMQRALDENSVIVAQMTPFFDEPGSGDH